MPPVAEAAPIAEPMAPLAETLLMFAARREHCEREIWPRLAAGEWVVCDRFTDATFAYQGGGRGVDTARIAELERSVLDGTRPDLTVIFDIPVAVSRDRLANGRVLDKFERQQAEFFERVRATYLARAAAEPQRCRVIDGTRNPDDVRAELDAIVAAL